MYAVVPAHNEAPSVAGVVQALRGAGCFEDVVVVDDGSTDDTAARAESAGAVAIRTPRNLGKGGAMLFAYESLPAAALEADDRVAFFDADLLGLRPEHVTKLADVSARGYDMVSMLRDRSAVANALQLVSPLITGERVVRRWVLDDLPQTCWQGYCIETALNELVERRGGKSAIVQARGVRPRTKLNKVGVIDGLCGQIKMVQQIWNTRKALRSSEGMSCVL